VLNLIFGESQSMTGPAILTSGPDREVSELESESLATTVPPVADIVCSAGSRLQCHVRRHCHAKIKAKIGCYAILHATFADYIRLNISHHILLFDSEKWMNK